MKIILTFIFICIPAFAVSESKTEIDSNQASPVHLSIFDNIAGNTLNSFTGGKIFLQVAGISLTYLLVSQDVDYKVYAFFSKNENIGRWFSPVPIIGAMGPLIVAPSLYFYGKHKSDPELVGAGCAVLQAGGIALFYTSLLKAITGRPHADPEKYSDMEKLSKTFRFGLFKGGVFWGWPSGHTAITMASVSALSSYYPKNLWLKLGGYALAVYTAIGVSAVNKGQMHWFSDAVAASFMTYAIGSTVGNYYRKALSNRKEAGFQIQPAFCGFKIAYLF